MRLIRGGLQTGRFWGVAEPTGHRSLKPTREPSQADQPGSHEEDAKCTTVLHLQSQASSVGSGKAAIMQYVKACHMIAERRKQTLDRNRDLGRLAVLPKRNVVRLCI